MKRSKEFVNTRRETLLHMINKTKDIHVNDLAEHLGVSEATVRRDLQFLEDRKSLERYYGGARVLRRPVLSRRDEQLLCREAISCFAASKVEDGDTIFINTSGTALRMIRYITARDVTVITNNGNAVTAEIPNTVNVLLTGGELRNIKGTMVGEFALHNIEKVTATKAFIGCSGLSVENGMTTQFLNEVDINNLMLQRTRERVYILADHTKLGINSSFVSCRIGLLTDIITDEKADEEIVSAFRERGICVDTVPMSFALE